MRINRVTVIGRDVYLDKGTRGYDGFYPVFVLCESVRASSLRRLVDVCNRTPGTVHARLGGWTWIRREQEQ